jgi:hypothetical protein
MPMLVTRLKVKDFAVWKQGFDGGKALRDNAGLTNPRIFRSADDASQVVILMDAADIAKAKSFASSPELKARMAAIGVADTPDFYFLNPAG